MKIYSAPLILFFIISVPSVSSQSEGTCVGRCGQGYVRSDPCHCDYNCMSYLECCTDYKKVCTTEGSCKGRCHEGFIRGQACDCDPTCERFGRCCSDYKEHCVKPTEPPQTPPPSRDRTDPDERDKPLKPTKKPKDRIPEDIPEDRIQKDEAFPDRAKKRPLDKTDPSKSTPNVAQPSKKTNKRIPRRTTKKRNNLSPGEDTEDPYERKVPSASRKKILSKKNKKNPKYYYPKRPRKKKQRNYVDYDDEEEDFDQRRSPPKNKKRPSKKSPKTPIKKKVVVESEEEIEESEENESSSSFSSSSSSSSVKGSKKTKKLRKNQRKNEDDPDNPDKDPRDPNRTPKDKHNKSKKPKTPKDGDDDPESRPKEKTPEDRDRNPTRGRGTGDDPKDRDRPDKEPTPDDRDRSPTRGRGTGDDPKDRNRPDKEPTPDDRDRNPTRGTGTGDDPKDRDRPDKEKTPEDKDRNPTRGRGTGDDPKDRDRPDKEPTPDDKDKNPKKPKGTGDDPDDPNSPPKAPNQRDPDDGNKPRKPKGKDGDDPDGTGKPPKRPNPKDKKKPKETSSLEIEENIEERSDANNANREDSRSLSNQRSTRKRSPARKKPKRLGDDTDDPDDDGRPRKPKSPKEKEGVDPDNRGKPPKNDAPEDPSPSDKGKKKPNPNSPNRKKDRPTDEDDEPSKPGKGKNPKRKPNTKAISKIKKKVDSEEERQETVESEFQSSSQSSSSHSRSKSTSRRLTGKNKKNLLDKKKKFPEDPPEDPLMPPKKRKDKDSPLTPEPTFPDEGSGDNGSGMDFLPTTTPTRTLMVNSTTAASPTTAETNSTKETINATTSPTGNPDVTSDKAKPTTASILPTKEEPEKTTNVMKASTQSPTTEDITTAKSTSTDTPQSKDTKHTTAMNEMEASDIVTHSTVAGNINDVTTIPSQDEGSKINTRTSATSPPILTKIATTETIDGKYGIESTSNTDILLNDETHDEINKETSPYPISKDITAESTARTSTIVESSTESIRATPEDSRTLEPRVVSLEATSSLTENLVTLPTIHSTEENKSSPPPAHSTVTTDLCPTCTDPCPTCTESKNSIIPTENNANKMLSTLVPTEPSQDSKTEIDKNTPRDEKTIPPDTMDTIETFPTGKPTVQSTAGTTAESLRKSETSSEQSRLTSEAMHLPTEKKILSTFETLKEKQTPFDITSMQTTPKQSTGQTIGTDIKSIGPTVAKTSSSMHSTEDTRESRLTSETSASTTIENKPLTEDVTSQVGTLFTTTMKVIESTTDRTAILTSINNVDSITEKTIQFSSPAMVTEDEKSTAQIHSTPLPKDFITQETPKEEAINIEETSTHSPDITVSIDVTVSPDAKPTESIYKTTYLQEGTPSIGTTSTEKLPTQDKSPVPTSVEIGEALKSTADQPTPTITTETLSEAADVQFTEKPTTSMPSTVEEDQLSTVETNKSPSVERSDPTSEDNRVTSNTEQINTMQTTDSTKQPNTDDVNSTLLPSKTTAIESASTAENIEIEKGTTATSSDPTDAAKDNTITSNAEQTITLPTTDITRQQDTEDSQSTSPTIETSAIELAMTSENMEKGTTTPSSDPTDTSKDNTIISNTAQTITLQTTDVTKPQGTDDILTTLIPTKITTIELASTAENLETGTTATSSNPTDTSTDNIITSNTAQAIILSTTEITKPQSTNYIHSTVPDSDTTAIESATTAENTETGITTSNDPTVTSKDNIITSNTAQAITLPTTDTTRQQVTKDIQSTSPAIETTAKELAMTSENMEVEKGTTTPSSDPTDTSRDNTITSNTEQTITMPTTDVTKPQGTDDILTTTIQTKITTAELATSDVNIEKGTTATSSDPTDTSKSNTAETSTSQTTDITIPQNTDDYQTTLPPSKTTANELATTVKNIELREGSTTTSSDPTDTSKDNIIRSNTAQTTTDVTKPQSTDDIQSTLLPTKITTIELATTDENIGKGTTTSSDPTDTSKDNIITSNTEQTILQTTDITKPQGTDNILTTLLPSKITTIELASTAENIEEKGSTATSSDLTDTSKDNTVTSNTEQTMTLQTTDGTKPQSTDDIQSTIIPIKITTIELVSTAENMEEGKGSTATSSDPTDTSRDNTITSNTAQTVTLPATDITKQQENDIQSTVPDSKTAAIESATTAENIEEKGSTAISSDPTDTSKDNTVTSNTEQTITLATTDVTKPQGTDDILTTLLPTKITTKELVTTAENIEKGSTEISSDPTDTSKDDRVTSNTEQTITLPTTDITKPQTTDDIQSTIIPTRITTIELVSTDENTEGKGTTTPSDSTDTSKDDTITSNTAQTITLPATDITKQQDNDIQSTVPDSKTAAIESATTAENIETGIATTSSDPTDTSKDDTITSNTEQTITLPATDITKQQDNDIQSTVPDSKTAAIESATTAENIETGIATTSSDPTDTSKDDTITSNTAQTITLPATDITKQQDNEIQSTVPDSKTADLESATTAENIETGIATTSSDPTDTSKDNIITSNTEQTITLPTTDIAKSQSTDDIQTTIIPTKITTIELVSTAENMEGKGSTAISSDPTDTSNAQQTITLQTTDITKPQGTDDIQSTLLPTKITSLELASTAENSETGTTAISSDPTDTSTDDIITSNTAQAITLPTTDITIPQSTDDRSDSDTTAIESATTDENTETGTATSSDPTDTSKDNIITSNTAQAITMPTTDITKPQSTDDIQSTLITTKITTVELASTAENIEEKVTTATSSDPTDTFKDNTVTSNAEQTITLQTTDITKPQNADDIQSTLLPTKITSIELATTEENMEVKKGTTTSSDSSPHSSSSEQALTPTTATINTKDIYSTISDTEVSVLETKTTNEIQTEGIDDTSQMPDQTPHVTMELESIASTTMQSLLVSDATEHPHGSSMHPTSLPNDIQTDILSTVSKPESDSHTVSPTGDTDYDTSKDPNEKQTINVQTIKDPTIIPLTGITDSLFHFATSDKPTPSDAPESQTTDVSPTDSLFKETNTEPLEETFSSVTAVDRVTSSVVSRETVDVSSVETSMSTVTPTEDQTSTSTDSTQSSTTLAPTETDTSSMFSSSSLDNPTPSVAGTLHTTQGPHTLGQVSKEQSESTSTDISDQPLSNVPTVSGSTGETARTINPTLSIGSSEEPMITPVGPSTVAVGTEELPLSKEQMSTITEAPMLLSTQDTQETSPVSRMSLSETSNHPFVSKENTLKYGLVTGETTADQLQTSISTIVAEEAIVTTEGADGFTTMLDRDSTADQSDSVTRNAEVSISDKTNPMTTQLSNQGEIAIDSTYTIVDMAKSTIAPTKNDTPLSTSFKLLDKLYATGGTADPSSDKPLSNMGTTISQGLHTHSTLPHTTSEIQDYEESSIVSTLKTPQDQSTTDSSGKSPTTVSQETTNSPSYSTNPVDPTKQSLPITDNATTQKSEQAQTKEITTQKEITVITETTTRISDQTTLPKITTKGPSAEAKEKITTEQPVYQTTQIPEEEPEFTTMRPRKPRPTPTKRVAIKTTTKPTGKDDIETSTKTARPTKTPKPRGYTTSRPMEPEDMEDTKTNKPTTNPYHVCDLLKDEAIKLRISDYDLKNIIQICTEMQQQYPLVSTPSPDVKQPNADDRNIPTSIPYVIPNGNPQPGARIIQIVEEINRRMNGYPMPNITGVHTYTIHRPSKWQLLFNTIKSANDPQKNLCIGQPADGMTTLQNGSMVVFRGQYFWMLNQGGVIESPRKITEVWGIPSPIDTVFTRCNCGGKTFFFKGPRYWRFTNDVVDPGYPKEIIKGFGGLSGKVTAVLPVAGFRTRPESVYFFKPSGTVQKYTFRQEQTKRCTKKKRPSVEYPVYTQRVQTVRYRYPRAIMRHRIQIHRTFSTVQQPLGLLHQETTVRQTWRGVPNNIVSAVSLPNYQKPDGFDYYVFTKDKYYNINMSSKVAVKQPPGAEQTTTKDWYKCKE
ncbi:proteoglycan 4 isoform X1 [Hyla sarda]|uniref:proteoglycan 4 isoform X1 n=1 Tax=Hyla sarda TaxID=327740 RepID=UPI0024C43836|nr:proteoglycan 4 isoform X1 [Hyla sarda]